MQRRGFLQSLWALAGIGGLAPRLHALPTVKTVLLQTAPLAGFQYHEGENLWPQLTVGDELQLTLEPLNPYDPQAVRLDWRGSKLGYLPRRDNTTVSQLLDRGELLQARISRLQFASNPWEQIELEVYLEG